MLDMRPSGLCGTPFYRDRVGGEAVKVTTGTNPTLATVVPRVRTPKEILEFLLDRENASWWGSAIELEHHVDGEALYREALEAVKS